MPASFSGGCVCGAIRYESSAEPLYRGNCQCQLGMQKRVEREFAGLHAVMDEIWRTQFVARPERSSGSDRRLFVRAPDGLPAIPVLKLTPRVIGSCPYVRHNWAGRCHRHFTAN
jgi:hypothetical protein